METYKLPGDIEYYKNSYDDDAEIREYKKIGPMPGLLELLKSLKENGLKIAVATSASEYRMQAVLDMFDLNEFFDVLVCSDDIHQSKPDPEIYLKTAKALGVGPNECIVIEDAENGVKAAKAAGMQCIGYINKNSGQQDLSQADQIVESLTEIAIG